MTLTPRSRLAIFLALAALMAATRLNHFGAVPDASWGVFFLAGFYLRGSLRWAFPVLMVVAVAADYIVISGSGGDFWSHYCVSPGYWFLVPAYLSLSVGGMLVRRYSQGPVLNTLAIGVVALFASVALCHLFAQGGFYWLSNSVTEPSFAGWAKNYGDWFLPYLRTAGVYVAIAVLVHGLFSKLPREVLVGRDERAG